MALAVSHKSAWCAAARNMPADNLCGAYTKAKKVGNKSVCIITGASSGLGLATAKKLADGGRKPFPKTLLFSISIQQISFLWDVLLRLQQCLYR